MLVGLVVVEKQLIPGDTVGRNQVFIFSKFINERAKYANLSYYIARHLISVGLETAPQNYIKLTVSFSSYIPEAKGVYCET